MDFKLSYHWLQEFVAIRMPPSELAELLSLHSVSVERVRRMDEGVDARVLVGRVERIEKHPNADKLRVAYVATRAAGHGGSRAAGQQGSGAAGQQGSGAAGQQGSGAAGQMTKVVCGGTNLREGMLVAFAPSGAYVRWHGQGDLVELKPTEIRGIRSEGMICAASEIGLAEYFQAEQEREILDVSWLAAGQGGSRAAGQGAVNVVGQPLAKALGLDDTILECEITTNRPDLMSVEELAREVAAITHSSFRPRQRRVEKSPLDRTEISRLRSTSLEMTKKVQVRIEDKKGCIRYGAVAIDGVTVGPSPWWVQRRLLAAGLRPINNVVDATNYAMLELGQPLHAFDAHRMQSTADSRQSQGIEIRRAKSGESIAALDENTYALTPNMLVIADAERPIAIAGIIGGQECAVTDATTRIVLECANFDAISIRNTMRALRIRTDAGIRFEKGLQPEAIPAVLPRAIELITAIAGGTAGKPTIVGATSKSMRPIPFHTARAAERIGMPITPSAMHRTLTALGCAIKKKTSGFFSVTPPWWRRGDIVGHHDLVEEVARMHGYHALPAVLPVGTLPMSTALAHPERMRGTAGVSPRTAFDWEQRAREVLADLGATEIMAYSLTSRTVVETAGFTADQCVAIENPLSEDLALLRPSLIPTLLPIIAANHEHTPKGVVFEMGKAYIPAAEQQSSRAAEHRCPAAALPCCRTAGLPREEMRLLVAAYGRLMAGGHVEKLKGIIERLFRGLGIHDVEFRRSGDCVTPTPNSQSPAPCRWHPGRTMDVVIGGVLAGTVGEIHPSVVETAHIDARVAVAELDWAVVLARCGTLRPITQPPTLPPAKRDLAFTVDRTTPYADIAAVLDGVDPLLVTFELFDTYEGAGIPPGKKSMAFHLTYAAPDRTLTTAEVDGAVGRITGKLRERFGAEIRN
ncbi:phenylalanine--tRNA ligase subunit beta [Candidatus Uhrbacteria bacterium]|nr:phenylalanine--tRNA ligase subunit beta [Candidatus Uhrbacteria bacterium]